MLYVSFIKKRVKWGGAIQHIIYLIITSFGLDLRVTWEFEGTELFNFFKTAFKLYQFSILNGSKKMRNLIRIALKWLFFSEISQKLPCS